MTVFVVWFCSLQVESQVSKLYCVSRADPVLPFQIEDASRSVAEYDRASQVRYTDCSSLVVASNNYIPDQ